MLGDFNADIKSDSVYGSELIEFYDINNLCFIDKSMLLPDSFKNFSAPHETTSWLDHCVTTDSGESIISDNVLRKILHVLFLAGMTMLKSITKMQEMHSDGRK